MIRPLRNVLSRSSTKLYLKERFEKGESGLSGLTQSLSELERLWIITQLIAGILDVGLGRIFFNLEINLAGSADEDAQELGQGFQYNRTDKLYVKI